MKHSRCFSEILLFFYDPMDNGNLISGFSVFSKSSLNIWNFLFHGLLKPILENLEHFTLLVCEMSAIVGSLFRPISLEVGDWCGKNFKPQICLFINGEKRVEKKSFLYSSFLLLCFVSKKCSYGCNCVLKRWIWDPFLQYCNGCTWVNFYVNDQNTKKP